MYRKLNKTETQILETLKKRGKVARGLGNGAAAKLKVDYAVQGNMTVAMISGTRQNLVGVAKYNPNDAELGQPYVEGVGQSIAFARAVSAVK
jgi:hypothetical protein